jgi:hypothetical protein
MLKALPSGQLKTLSRAVAALTMPISWSSTSRCCSKKDFSVVAGPPVDDDAAGLFVLEDIVVDVGRRRDGRGRRNERD